MRVTKVLLLTTLMVGLAAGPAHAARAQVNRFTFRGAFAEAVWSTSTASSFTDTDVNASKATSGQELFVDQFTANLDGNGNFTGATDTFADVTTGFSFSIDRNLSSASVSGSDVPATTCTYDADFKLIGCTDTTIDVTASWTGQGPIGRGTFHDQFHSDGFTFTDHFQGTSRDATASGSIGGLSLTAGDLDFADMGQANYGETDICIGC